MRISDDCARCMYDRQKFRDPDPQYLKQVRDLIDNRGSNDTAPLMVYRFDRLHEKYRGPGRSWREEKKKYNDLVLGMKNELREKIRACADPLAASLAMARVGNYIDFGAMDHVDEKTFLGLFEDAILREEELQVYHAFVKACEKGKTFLLLADNCGEIVLDMLMLECLRERFPHLRITVMVRGGEAVNDVTTEDAAYVGLEKAAQIVSNGAAAAGTIYELMPEESRRVLDMADVILSKGQGNYESLAGQGRPVFYLFLCKCKVFTQRFQVPPLTGMFVREEQ